jgi:hypothetical protein
MIYSCFVSTTANPMRLRPFKGDDGISGVILSTPFSLKVFEHPGIAFPIH